MKLRELFNNKVYLVGAIVVLLAVGYSIGRYVAPEKVKTVTKIKEVEVKKESSEKESSSDQHKEKQFNRQTKTVITEKPDGTKVTEIYEVNKDVVFLDKKEESKESSEKEKISKKESKSKKVVERSKPQWKVNALVGYRVKNKFSKPIYGASVERRVFGPAFLGIWADTGKRAGVSVGIEF